MTTYADYIETSFLDEDPRPGHIDSSDMIKKLIEDKEKLIRTMRDALEKVDAVTEDMLIAVMTTHEKDCWMLRSMLQEA